MPVDIISGEFVVLTRDQDRDLCVEDYKFRIPNADTGPNSQPFKDACVAADMDAPLYANAKILAAGTSWSTATGEMLVEHAEAIGRPANLPSSGFGYVIIEAATGGGLINGGTSGEELRTTLGVRFRVVATDTYEDGDLCAIQGIDTGDQTNLDPGTKLTWVSPPTGILTTCLVFENADGSGITGGAAAKSEEEVKADIREVYAEPAASGNDPDIIQFVQDIPGIAIQKVFCIPCMQGAGEYAVLFTMRPDVLGGSRLPNSAHIALVEAEIVAHFPADDGIYVCQLLDHEFAVCLEITGGWTDTVPWPPYDATKVVVSGAATPTVSSARLSNCTTAPSIGKNISFYDSTTRTFKVKRLLTVTSLGGNVYDVTFNMVGSASDPAFLPTVGAIVSPWGPNISAVVDPILTYVDLQGPGEQVSVFPELGRRKRRVPFSKPTTGGWPHEVNNSILDDVFDAVGSNVVLLEPTTSFATTVGTPGVLSYLHRVSDIGVFAP